MPCAVQAPLAAPGACLRTVILPERALQPLHDTRIAAGSLAAAGDLQLTATWRSAPADVPAGMRQLFAVVTLLQQPAAADAAAEERALACLPLLEAPAAAAAEMQALFARMTAAAGSAAAAYTLHFAPLVRDIAAATASRHLLAEEGGVLAALPDFLGSHGCPLTAALLSGAGPASAGYAASSSDASALAGSPGEQLQPQLTRTTSAACIVDPAVGPAILGQLQQLAPGNTSSESQQPGTPIVQVPTSCPPAAPHSADNFVYSHPICHCCHLLAGWS